MPKDFSRTSRLGEQIQREVAQMIQFEMKNPKLGMVTLNSVKNTTTVEGNQEKRLKGGSILEKRNKQ